jgi:hypothetical protein
MRLLQLQLDGDDGPALELHPRLTILSGLDDAGRARLIEAVRSLPSGSGPAVGGLVEAHGVLFDLSPETLELLGMHSDLDPVVSRSDLPGSAPAQPSEPLPVARVSIEQFLATTPEGAHPDLDACRHRQRSARETLAILREAADRAKRDHTDAASRGRVAAAALARATGDHTAAPADVAAGEPTPSEVTDPVELEARRDELMGHLARVEEGLAELSGLDTRPIEVLLDAIRNPTPSEFIPSERAAELADEFVALRAQVDELERELEAEGRGTASAMDRLEAARAELADAERAMRKPSLSPADVEELEAAHRAVLDAESGVSGLRRKAGQKRFEEAHAAEQVILDRVGFPTWSAYVMGAGLLGIDPVAEQRLDRARQAFEEVDAHWAQVAAAIEADPEHSALLDRLETVYLEAFDLLGGDDEHHDLEAALRSFRQPKVEVTNEELVNALAYQLSLVGLDLGTTDPGMDRTLLGADVFLAEVRGISDRVAELQQEHEQLTADLADVERSLERLGSEAERRATIDLTDAALATDGGGEVDLDALQVELDQAVEDEADYAEQLEARLALVDAATRVEAVASSRLIRLAGELAQADADRAPAPDEPPRPASDPAFEVGPGEPEGGVEAIEFYLLARLAAQRSLSFAGSVPILIDNALADLARDDVTRMLNELERMSESVQIIYLTEDPHVLDWTVDIGVNHAAIVSAPRQPA